MNKIDNLRKQLEAIKEEIEKISGFRDTPALRKFIRNLQGEASHLREQISHLTKTREEKETQRSERQLLANKNRSEKMKRTWRFIKAIQANYPTKLSLRELRSAFKKHKQGLETDIRDVAWRNPSP